MKYAVILGDGMADIPVDSLGGKTPLQCAHKSTIDYFARHGETGLVRTIPEGCYPGSDTANLSVLGYDPQKYYTGRSPLEAVSMGIELKDTDTAFRCNLVSLSPGGDYDGKTMLDYSSDEISTPEARELIEYAAKHLASDSIKLYAGVSYRHCLVYEGFDGAPKLAAPHNITGQIIGDYLPKGRGTSVLADMMRKSFELLDGHEINIKRRQRGLKPGNSLWFWGEGTRPALDSFSAKYGVKGVMISAVDLLKGIAICAGLKNIDVPGATGNIDTNYTGKGDAAVKALLKDGADFVYIHVEAPDECGHRGEIKNKIRSIELIDEHIVAPLKKKLDDSGEDYCIMVLPDHPTPVIHGKHTDSPVPYVIYRSFAQAQGAKAYDEESAAATGIFVSPGHTLMQRFIDAGKR